MPKIYTKNTWEDEVLAGDERYDIKTNAGVAIETNVQIDLVTAVTTAGTAVDADKMNNLEDGVDALDTLLSSMRSAATELTIASDAVTITQSNHKLQPQSGTADDLSTISGTTAGQSGVLYASDYGTDTITIKHNVGNILCMGAADVSLSQGCVFWHSDGTKVYISGGGGGGGGSYIPTSYLDTDGTLAANSDVKVATQKAVKTYVDTKITGLLEYRGAFSAAANPNYPGANAGDSYLISAAGKVGGASGKSVDAGDFIVAIAYNVGGTEASVGTSWTVLEHNLEGALLAANNLSDLASAATARTNLGLTANGSSLVTAADYAAMKVLLSLTIGTDVQAYHARLADLAGITYAQGDVLYFNGTNIVKLAAGTNGYFLKTQGAGANPVWAAIAGGGDLLAANNLSDLANAGTARTNLGLAIGTNVQAYDAELAALAGLTSAADSFPYFTGSGTAALLSIVSAIRTLLASADVATFRSNAGLAIGTNVQAYDAELAAIAGLTSAADKLPYFTGSGTASVADFSSFGRTLVDDADAAAARTTLGALGSAGGTLTGAVNLGENAGLELDAALSADGKYSGITEAGTAGATLAFGDLCYLQTSDSRWELVDANAAATCSNKLGMCVLAAASDGSATTMLLFGKIRADAAFPALTIGAPVFASTTAGDVQTTAPSGAADIIRIIGYGNTADELHFCPSNDYFEHA